MDYVVAPFTVIVDTREQHPYRFQGFEPPARYRRKDGTLPPLIVPIEQAALKSGDYSIKGYEDQVAIERKSLPDAYSTFCWGRERFIRELERLNDLAIYAGVYVEETLINAAKHPPDHTQYTGKSLVHQFTSWEIRYRRVSWRWCEGRAACEFQVYRTLEKTYDLLERGEIP